MLAPNSDIDFPDLGINPSRCVKAGLADPLTIHGMNYAFFQQNTKSGRYNANDRFYVFFRFRSIPKKCNLGFSRSVKMRVTGVKRGMGRHIVTYSGKRWWPLASSNSDGVGDGPYGLEEWKRSFKSEHFNRTVRVRAKAVIRVFRLQDHKLMGSRTIHVKWRRGRDICFVRGYVKCSRLSNLDR